jgi:flagellar hook capping protein FlgD
MTPHQRTGIAPSFVSALAQALLLACCLLPGVAFASWATNGNQVAIAPNNEVNAQTISDSSGGLFVVWQDFRSDSADIYAQRFDMSGNRLWGSGGVAVCTVGNHQESPVLCSNGSGGIIVAWQDRRTGSYDIYAQALNGSGTLLWTPATGVPLCTATGNQILEVITSDGAGGAIVGWRDTRLTLNADIYAQRVNASGVTQWAADGVAVCTAAGQQTDVRILSDGIGGAFLVWRDARNGAFDNDIYAQSLDSGGNARWAANGVGVAAVTQDQVDPTIASDGQFGLLVTWQDNRNGTDSDIFAQRIKPDGTPRWPANGIQICDQDSSQVHPLVATDGIAGAIVAWTDSRNGSRYPDVFAQRVDSTGALAWVANGIAVCTADSGQFPLTIVPDKSGGVVVGWDDERGAGTDEDIYAQGLTRAGTIRWSPSGVRIATGAGTRHLTSSAADGFGGSIFAWEDDRSGTRDVYAFRLSPVGTGVDPSSPAAAPRFLTPRPNPFNPHTTIDFTLDAPSHFRLAIHDVQGRLVRVLAEGTAPAGSRSVAWDGSRSDGTPCASGAYFAVLSLPSGNRSTTLRLIR